MTADRKPLLEIEYLIEGGDGPVGWYYSRGHHDSAEFLAELEAEYGIATEWGLQVGDVRHVYARKVPRPHGSEDFELGQWEWVEQAGPGRGAFAATIVGNG